MIPSVTEVRASYNNSIFARCFTTINMIEKMVCDAEWSGPRDHHGRQGEQEGPQGGGHDAGAGAPSEHDVIGYLGKISSHFWVPDLVHLWQVNPENLMKSWSMSLESSARSTWTCSSPHRSRSGIVAGWGPGPTWSWAWWVFWTGTRWSWSWGQCLSLFVSGGT